jgi:acetoin utilization deacetylase AcuC-like enzyme
MKAFYHPVYGQPSTLTGPGKCPLLRERLLADQILSADNLRQPAPLDRQSFRLVHSDEYLDKLAGATLSTTELRRMGLTWSEALWERAQLSVAGTYAAACAALAEGMAANLAGGGHHAFADHGEGFCILNDVAVAIAQLLAEGRITRAAVIDLDVHQGNGTAEIFRDSPDVFTFSMHGERNYPLRKSHSSLDVGLPDGMGDVPYLALLDRHLPPVLAFQPQIVFYVAGVDVAQGDRYGRLALTEPGILARDQRVIGAVRDAGVPLTIVLGGGYAATRERTAELHALVFRAACEYERGH